MEACHAAWRVGRIRTPVALAYGRAVFLGDDLFACQPLAEAIQVAGGNFILTCKPLSHQTVSEYLSGTKLNRVYFGNHSFSSSGSRWSLTQRRSATA
jgi:hypothetical protein